MKELNLHPLINPDSGHYDTDDKTAVEKLEEEYTVDEVIAFCKINIYKYSYRENHKGQKASDVKKIKTYRAYLTMLNSLESKGFGNMIVKRAYGFTNTQWRYR